MYDMGSHGIFDVNVVEMSGSWNRLINNGKKG